MELEEALRDGARFEAVKALVVYRLEAGYDSAAHYVTTHDITKGALAEGQPLTKNALVELCSLVMPEIRQTVKFIPENVLAYTPGHEYGVMAWWRPPQVRHLHFHRNTGIPSGPAPVPATLFVVRGGEFYVWALDVKGRPTPEARVYYPPFFNILPNGMCMGSMRPPKSVRAEDIDRWEGLFFDSAFTTEAEPLLEDIEASTLWKRLITRKAKRFPMKHLKPCRTMTVKDLMEGM
jgi:PRTRC genetic system protein B